ncbi:MAG TPA: nucleotidyltransferase domain-containing protein [Candidatus Thermoplasmatota archaeon]|nr:nucleotidyltransferase domain-containing protein [Candidatus Thermoplasmatota archaeon]
MATTVWVETKVREALRHIQEALGTTSANATILRLIEQPAPDARSLFSRYRKPIREIMRRHKLRRLVAFGSRARGDARLDSDLDVALELGEGAAPLALLAAEADLEDALGIRVNAIELPNDHLADTLKREGVPFEAG